MSFVMHDYPSPNYEERPKDAAIKYLILHYTECNLEQALWILAENQVPPRVSCHYVIDVNGDVYRLVPEHKKAWHAGISYWEKDEHLNNFSIGIELVNLGHAVTPLPLYPAAQIRALKGLCKEIFARHPSLLPCHVLGHSDIRPLYKQDPGEHFNWQALAQAGIGLWPWGWKKYNIPELEIFSYQQALKRYGYNCPQTGSLDQETCQVIKAFQRHFSPYCVDGQSHRTDHQKLVCLLGKKKRLLYSKGLGMYPYKDPSLNLYPLQPSIHT